MVLSLRGSTEELDMRINKAENQLSEIRGEMREMETKTNRRFDGIEAKLDKLQENLLRTIAEQFAIHFPKGFTQVSREQDGATSKVQMMEKGKAPTAELTPLATGNSSLVHVERETVPALFDGKVEIPMLDRNFESDDKQKEELKFGGKRSSNLQEKSTTTTDRSLQTESYFNVDVAFPGTNQERDGRKKQEIGGESGVEIEQLGPPPWSRQSRDETKADRSETKAEKEGEGLADRTDQELSEGCALEIEQLGPPPWSRSSKEELERKFEKTVLKAAREVGSDYALWLVGFDFFEPVFILERGKEFSEPVGSPLWFEDTGNGFESGRWEMKQKCVGPSLKSIGPSIWPNIPLISFQRVDGKLRSTGPIFLPVNDELKGKYEEEVIGHPLSTDFACRCTRLSFKPPPRDKPPPRPPESPSDCLRLELISTISICPVAHGLISLRINGKVDAAGDDPGDLGFYQISSSASIFDFIHSLEDKAGLMELARPVVFIRGSLADDKGSGQRPPAEPPPISSFNLGLILKRHKQDRPGIIIWYGDSKASDCTSLVSLSKQISTGFTILDQAVYVIVSSVYKLDDKLLVVENHEDDQTRVLFCHSPRPPEFAHNKEVLLSDSKWDNWLIMDNYLQVQRGIEFEMSSELWQSTSNLEKGISLDKWELKLKLVKAQAEIRLNDQLTQQEDCTFMNSIKINPRVGRIQEDSVRGDEHWQTRNLLTDLLQIIGIQLVYVDFKIHEDLLTHQGNCTLDNPIKLHSFGLARSTRCHSVFLNEFNLEDKVV